MALRVSLSPSAEMFVCSSGGEVARAAADVVLEVVDNSATKRTPCSIALSGGSTPKQMLALLAAATAAPYGDRDWSFSTFFLGDERYAPLEHSYSSEKMIIDVFLVPLSKITLPSRMPKFIPYPRRPANVGEGTREELAAAAQIFAALLQPLLPVSLVILGCGPDGHTASMFPGTEAIDEAALDVTHCHPTDPTVNPQVHRLTITFRPIAAARRVLLLAVGKEKQPVIAALTKTAQEAPPPSTRASELPFVICKIAALPPAPEGGPTVGIVVDTEAVEESWRSGAATS